MVEGSLFIFLLPNGELSAAADYPPPTESLTIPPSPSSEKPTKRSRSPSLPLTLSYT